MSDALTATLVEGAIAGARWLWHKAHGDDTAPDEAQLKAIAIAGVTAQLQRIELELQRLAAIAGMQIATDKLAQAAIEMRDAIRALESKPGVSFGALPAEQMSADWKPPQHEWRATVPGEPLEENGVCTRCGKYASESYLACVERP